MQQLINKTPIPNDELIMPICTAATWGRQIFWGKRFVVAGWDLLVHLEGTQFCDFEVSLKQGTGGDNFIDPEPIIKGVKAARKSLQLTKLKSFSLGALPVVTNSVN